MHICPEIYFKNKFGDLTTIIESFLEFRVVRGVGRYDVLESLIVLCPYGCYCSVTEAHDVSNERVRMIEEVVEEKYSEERRFEMQGLVRISPLSASLIRKCNSPLLCDDCAGAFDVFSDHFDLLCKTKNFGCVNSSYDFKRFKDVRKCLKCHRMLMFKTDNLHLGVTEKVGVFHRVKWAVQNSLICPSDLCGALSLDVFTNSLNDERVFYNVVCIKNRSRDREAFVLGESVLVEYEFMGDVVPLVFYRYGVTSQFTLRPFKEDFLAKCVCASCRGVKINVSAHGYDTRKVTDLRKYRNRTLRKFLKNKNNGVIPINCFNTTSEYILPELTLLDAVERNHVIYLRVSDGVVYSGIEELEYDGRIASEDRVTYFFTFGNRRLRGIVVDGVMKMEDASQGFRYVSAGGTSSKFSAAEVDSMREFNDDVDGRSNSKIETVYDPITIGFKFNGSESRALAFNFELMSKFSDSRALLDDSGNEFIADMADLSVEEYDDYFDQSSMVEPWFGDSYSFF